MQRLQEAGYEIKPGKYISCRAPGQERFTRLKPSVQIIQRKQSKNGLQASAQGRRKLPKSSAAYRCLLTLKTVSRHKRAGGYEQWAKIHNLKLAAKTMNFLTEHQIEQYADLISRIEEINAENEKTADALKSVEKRLADMAVLMKHVATYQKTKPTYEAYRRAKDKNAYRAKMKAV